MFALKDDDLEDRASILLRNILDEKIDIIDPVSMAIADSTRASVDETCGTKT